MGQNIVAGDPVAYKSNYAINHLNMLNNFLYPILRAEIYKATMLLRAEKERSKFFGWLENVKLKIRYLIRTKEKIFWILFNFREDPLNFSQIYVLREHSTDNMLKDWIIFLINFRHSGYYCIASPPCKQTHQK